MLEIGRFFSDFGVSRFLFEELLDFFLGCKVERLVLEETFFLFGSNLSFLVVLVVFPVALLFIPVLFFEVALTLFLAACLALFKSDNVELALDWRLACLAFFKVFLPPLVEPYLGLSFGLNFSSIAINPAV